MDKDTFIVVTWPDVQELMDLDGFEENSCLINDEPLLDEYGSSAYFVRESWDTEIKEEKMEKDELAAEDAKIETLKDEKRGTYPDKWDDAN